MQSVWEAAQINGSASWTRPYPHTSTNKCIAILNLLIFLAGTASITLVVDPGSRVARFAEQAFGAAATATAVIAVLLLTPMTPTSNSVSIEAHTKAVQNELERRRWQVAEWIDEDHDGTISRQELDRLRVALGMAEEFMDDKAWTLYCKSLGVNPAGETLTAAQLDDRTVLQLYNGIFGGDGLPLDPEQVQRKFEAAQERTAKREAKKHAVRDWIRNTIDQDQDGLLSRAEVDKLRLVAGFHKQDWRGEPTHRNASKLMDDSDWVDYCKELGVDATQEQSVSVDQIDERSIVRMHEHIFGNDGAPLAREEVQRKFEAAQERATEREARG